MNVIPSAFDATTERAEKLTDLEAQNFQTLLATSGLVDVYRFLNPITIMSSTTPHAWSQQGYFGWTYQNTTLLPRPILNPTCRLDYALISSTLTNSVKRFEVDYETQVSDHYPVELTLLFINEEEDDDGGGSGMKKNNQEQKSIISPPTTRGQKGCRQNEHGQNYPLVDSNAQGTIVMLPNGLSYKNSETQANLGIEEIKEVEENFAFHSSTIQQHQSINSDPKGAVIDPNGSQHKQKAEIESNRRTKNKQRQFLDSSSSKACEKCERGNNLLLCLLCDDAYHRVCLVVFLFAHSLLIFFFFF